MVILIGGVSNTGKTLMSQKLLEKYKMPYLSIDHLKMGIIRGQRYCDFTALDSNESIGNKLWPIIKGIIMTNIENRQNIIIEGCYLLPYLIEEFEPEYLNQIITLFIGFSKEYIEQHYVSGIVEHIREIEQKDVGDDWSVERFVGEHQELKELCQMNRANFFEVNEDYELEISKVYEWIDNKIKELENTKG